MNAEISPEAAVDKQKERWEKIIRELSEKAQTDSEKMVKTQLEARLRAQLKGRTEKFSRVTAQIELLKYALSLFKQTPETSPESTPELISESTDQSAPIVSPSEAPTAATATQTPTPAASVTSESAPEPASTSTPPSRQVPVPFWRRRTVQAIAALGLLGTIGTGIYKASDHSESTPERTAQTASASPASPSSATPAPTPAAPATSESAPDSTLYDQVGNVLEVKIAEKNLDEGVEARIHAASSNDLTESLYEGAKHWETLNGKWLDTPEAHANVVGKLTTWGGYPDVLTVSAGAHTIDEMLKQIATSNLPRAELVAWNVATQIASITDDEVVPDVGEVKTRMKSVTSDAIAKTLNKNIANPPPPPGPSFFGDQETSQMGSLDSSIYDAPEPVSLLAKIAPVEASTSSTVPSMVVVEEIPDEPMYEDRFDAIEPAHVKPVVQAKVETPMVPVFMDPIEAAEPVTLLTKREAEIPDVTEFLEEDPIPPPAPKPAPKPVPTLLENAKSAFSSLTSRFKSWLS